MSDLRITSFEFARVIGCRAQQISEGHKPYINPGNMTDAEEIAIEEFRQGKCPIIIIRTFPNGQKKQIKCKTQVPIAKLLGFIQ